MPTRGCFVCHVHCLVHDGAVRSSPCGPHHENFGQNLYHMFVPAYSASQSFVLFYLWYSSCFEVKCWIHTFPKRCSHIAMWILTPFDLEVVMLNSFPTDVLLFKWIRSFQHSQDHPSVFPTLFVSSVPKCPLFSRPPTLSLQGLRFLNQVSCYWWEVSPFFSSMFLPGDSHEDAKEASSLSFFILIFFSGGFNWSFQCWL